MPGSDSQGCSGSRVCRSLRSLAQAGKRNRPQLRDPLANRHFLQRSGLRHGGAAGPRLRRCSPQLIITRFVVTARDCLVVLSHLRVWPNACRRAREARETTRRPKRSHTVAASLEVPEIILAQAQTILRFARVSRASARMAGTFALL